MRAKTTFYKILISRWTFIALLCIVAVAAGQYMKYKTNLVCNPLKGVIINSYNGTYCIKEKSIIFGPGGITDGL